MLHRRHERRFTDTEENGNADLRRCNADSY